MNRRLLSSLVSRLLMLMSAGAWTQFAQCGGVEATVFDPSGAVTPGVQIAQFDLAQSQIWAGGPGPASFVNHR
jgi:hypothetical protein